jgi:hypothetical protein
LFDYNSQLLALDLPDPIKKVRQKRLFNFKFNSILSKIPVSQNFNSLTFLMSLSSLERLSQNF